MRVLALISTVAFLQAGTPSISFEDKVLASIPEEITVKNPIFSRDGKQVAYMCYQGAKCWVGVNKEKGPPYDAFGKTLVYSNDGRLAYCAASGNSWVVVVSGKASTSMAVAGIPVFSPDGRRVAYESSRGVGAARDGTAWCVMVDGQKGGDYASCGPPSFSADGSIVAHSVRIAKAGSAQRAMYTTHAMVLAGKPGPECDEVSSPVFAPKGHSMAYKARTDMSWSMIVDGKNQGGTYTAMGMPVWNPEGKSLAFRGVIGPSQECIVIDGKKGETYEVVSDPVWSPDGKQVAFTAQKGSDNFIMMGGKALEPFTSVGPPTWAPDGTKVAYGALGSGQWMMVVGDKKGRPDYDMVGLAVWSPDSKHVAFSAQWKYKAIVVIDDGKNEMFDATEPPVWSADSTKCAYAAQKDGKWYVVAAYKRFDPYDRILTRPFFSPDGKKVAFGAQKGNDLVWRVQTAE
jgi:Tol biopolymer transport system component